MSKAKKLLSVLLSCLLVLSCCVAGLTAFAEEPEAAIEAVDSNLDENAADVNVEDEVTDAVRDYNKLIQVKDSLTPEEKEALKEAEKKIVNFGLSCADVLTSSEAVDVYTQMYNTVASAADKALNDVDLKEALDAFQSAATDLLGSVDLNDVDLLNRLADAVDASEAEKPDISGYERTVVTYPSKAPKAQVEKAIPKVDDLLETVLPMLGVEGGLNNMIQTQLYTNKTVGTLAKALSALGKLLLGSEQSYAATLAECLAMVQPEFYWPNYMDEESDPILKGAAKKLFEVANIEDEEEFATAWEALEFEAGDFPFEDGDKEGFKDALASLFRPYGELASMIPLTNRVDEETGEVIYGGYEGLIPILEMLDLREVISSAEYTAFVENMTNEENDPNGIRLMEAYLRPVFDPIFNLIDDLGAAPFETVLDLLPKLGYMLKTDMLDSQISTLLEMMGMKEMVNDLLAKLAPDMFPNGLSLTTESIYNIVAPLLNNIKVKDAVVDKEGNEVTPAQTVSIKLDKEKFIQFINDLGGCGDAVVRDSVAVATEDAPYRVAIDSDKADALVVFLRWLYGEATTPENLEAFNTLIDNADMDAPVKSILKMVLSTVASKVSADDIIVLLVNVLAADVPNFDDITDKLPDLGGITDKLPGLPELPSFGGEGGSGIGGIVNTVIDTVKGLFGGGSDDGNTNNGGGTSQTGDPSIPKTGGKAVMSVMALAITAAAVAGAVSLKKKENDD